MFRIIMSDWKEGMQKVSLSHLQMELLGLSLKEAKENVDKVLEGESVEIEVGSSELAGRFLKAAQEIGVACRMV